MFLFRFGFFFGYTWDRETFAFTGLRWDGYSIDQPSTSECEFGGFFGGRVFEESIVVLLALELKLSLFELLHWLCPVQIFGHGLYFLEDLLLGTWKDEISKYIFDLF